MNLRVNLESSGTGSSYPSQSGEVFIHSVREPSLILEPLWVRSQRAQVPVPGSGARGEERRGWLFFPAAVGGVSEGRCRVEKYRPGWRLVGRASSLLMLIERFPRWFPAALIAKEVDMHRKHSVVRHSTAGSFIAVLFRAFNLPVCTRGYVCGFPNLFDQGHPFLPWSTLRDTLSGRTC